VGALSLSIAGVAHPFSATAAPSGSQVFALSGTAAAHGRFLVQLPGNGATSNPGAELPAPDLTTGGSVNPATAVPTVLPIATIQGTNTDTSPYAGQTVTTKGVVTAAYPVGGLNGFFLETGGPDTTPGASDAVFVFGSAAAGQVAIGDSVRVTGKVQEFAGLTEITGPAVTASAEPLPAAVPAALAWSELATGAQKEAHEGELLAPQGTFTVSDNYDANFYGSFTLAAGDQPLRQPTDAGRAGSAEARAAVADNAARTVTLDDGSSLNYSSAANAGRPLPWLTPARAVSVGAKVAFHQPVILEYRNSLWNFQPRQQVTGDGSAVATFTDTRAANQQPAATGGAVRLATFNVENYFPMTGERYVATGLGTCTYYNDRAGNHIGVNTCTGTDGSSGPRGAADAASFQRQQSKIVTGVNRLGAAIVSLEEIENSAKFGEPRDTALAGLVDALNAAAGSTVWAYVPSPPADRLPTPAQEDVIRSGFIYQPAKVTPVGSSTALTTESDPGESFSIAREPLAQGFTTGGAPFLVVANHWKSKGSGTPLYDGDLEDTSSPAVDQGAFNATRVHEAQDVTTFAAATAAELGTDRIFLVGDFNAYTHEDPLETLYAAGYTDLGSSLDPSEWTYSYNSLEGSLDHVLASPSARAMVTGADIWQINAQEAVAYAYSRYNYNATLLFDGADPFAASDHDPVVVGLNPPSAPAWNAATAYHLGDTVTDQGSTWQALWWTQNQAPGDPQGPWAQLATAPDGTALWTPSRVFTSGDVVIYQGKKYVAQWWTRNQVPSQPHGPWKLTA
jgi:predicted extracellular nuclease